MHFFQPRSDLLRNVCLASGGPINIGKGKSVPLQAWTGPEGSRKFRLPEFVTTAQNGGKVVSLTHRPLFTPQEILPVLISVRG